MKKGGFYEAELCKEIVITMRGWSGAPRAVVSWKPLHLQLFALHTVQTVLIYLDRTVLNLDRGLRSRT